MRLFVAINFAAETLARLITLRGELAACAQRGNFSLDENLHLTLAFLGACDIREMTAAKSALHALAFEPFTVAIDRVGYFKRDGGHLWWAGLREDKPLMQVQRDLAEQLRKSGFLLENRKYSPHITLGREVVTEGEPWSFEAFGEQVTRIDLMKSERIGGKLTYTVIGSKRSL